MSRGWSIHVGLNAVDTVAYRGWTGATPNAENDAAAMCGLAVARGFHKTTLLRGPCASRPEVHRALTDAAEVLVAGDLLLFSFAGHGAHTPDKARGERQLDEDDGFDESWCLHDGYLLDDELNDVLATFRAGVRIVVVADSCFSGTMTRALDDEEPIRQIPPELADAAYEQRRELYERIRAELRTRAAREVRASVLLLAACAEDRWAFEHDGQGLFTSGLLGVWNGGAFTGSYEELRTQIHARTGRQEPQLYRAGRVDPAFEAQTPFTISPGDP